MKIKYDGSQDITLGLTSEEAKVLRELENPTTNFYDLHNASEKPDSQGRIYILFKGICRELESPFFLGFTENFRAIAQGDIRNMDGFGEIVIPALETGDPWMINLSREGRDLFRRGWPSGLRYNSSSKLFVRGGK